MKVIVINGRGGVGKDTFISLLNSVAGISMNICNVSTIDPVKSIAHNIGWDGKKDEKSRKFLSDLKDLLTEFNDYPFEQTKWTMEMLDSDKTIFFVHVREPKDIDRFVKVFNAKTLLIKNDNVPLITSNHADKEAENYNYDYIIDNSTSIENLKRYTEVFYEDILKSL